MKVWWIVLILIALPMVTAQLEIGSSDGQQDTVINLITPTPTPFNNATDLVNISVFAEIWVTAEGLMDDIPDLFPTLNSIYCQLVGCSMTGNINMGSNNLDEVNNITIEEAIILGNYSIKQQESNEFIDGNILSFLFTEPAGTFPDFWLQPGGAGQASGITRSFIIADDNHSILGTTSQTDCKTWTDSVGVELKIDCNTTSLDNPLGSGADILGLGDIQLVGEIWLRDFDGEWHDFSRELTLLDELLSNITSTPINGTFNGTTLVITSIFDDFIAINIDRSEVVLEKNNDSIILTSGTNATPIFNEAFYKDRTNPTLALRTTLSEDEPRVGMFLLGDSGFEYASFVGGSTNNKFVQGVYNRILDQGSIYKSGFNIAVSSSEINISEGTMKVLLDTFDIVKNHTTNNLAIEILTNGTFHPHENSLDGLEEYGTGEVVSNNKFFNLVCGIAPTHDNLGRMYCVVQDKPTTEHNTLVLAENDNTFLNIFPANDLIKKLYIPIVRVVVRRTGGSNVIQTLSTGNMFFDLRGTITASGGSPPTPGITSHPDLANLESNVSGHTGFIFADGSVPLSENWNATKNIEAIVGFFTELGSFLVPITTGWITTINTQDINVTGQIELGGGQIIISSDGENALFNITRGNVTWQMS